MSLPHTASSIRVAALEGPGPGQEEFTANQGEKVRLSPTASGLQRDEGQGQKVNKLAACHIRVAV